MAAIAVLLIRLTGEFQVWGVRRSRSLIRLLNKTSIIFGGCGAFVQIHCRIAVLPQPLSLRSASL
ncbi:MAG: hypothetical protein KME42_28645 [Tildeniella nuda ZEHNDER 1965/U140]|nr:hypothetical protein [Tildeniella nuda ZEHNDER 1965/U140]